MTEDKLQWEWIHEGCLRRCKVPWGWLVQSFENVFHPSKVEYPGQFGTGFDYRIALTFVFDPFHWWKISNEKEASHEG